MPEAIGSRSSRGQPDAGFAGISSEITGPAATARATLAGARMATVQVSSADEIWLTSEPPVERSAFPWDDPPEPPAERSAGPARIGTTIAVSAPPRTMS